MPPSTSDPPAVPRLAAADEGVSEVVGFLLTFGIISAILVVAMLGFNDAQQRAEVRLIEIQGSSAAQRVASAAVELALFASEQNEDPAVEVMAAVAIDLPAELQGISYTVNLCQTGAVCGDGAAFCASFACPYVKVTSFRGEAQRQSTFLLGGEQFCTDADFSSSGGVVVVTYFVARDCIGLTAEQT